VLIAEVQKQADEAALVSAAIA
jgi:hypothetical protein